MDIYVWGGGGETTCDKGRERNCSASASFSVNLLESAVETLTVDRQQLEMGASSSSIFAELEASTILFSLLVFALFTLTGMLNETGSELLTNVAPCKGKIVLLGDVKEREMRYFHSTSCIAASS